MTLRDRYGDVSVEVTGDHVARVTIQRPPDNFFDIALITALADAYEAIDEDERCRAIVLGSEGGMDLGAVAEKSDLRSLVPEAGAAPPPTETGRARLKAGSRDVDVWMAAAKDLHALGDFSGSLEMIEKILKVDALHGEARDYLRQNEATLVAMYESKLGPLGRVPRLAIKPEEVMWLNLDHRAGFLLSQVDGAVDYESLFALSGLPRLDTARILATLIADGVITSG